MDQTTERRTPASACPICGKPAQPRFRPFCSRRCANVDFNRWLRGVYAVPVVEEAAGEPAAAAAADEEEKGRH